MKEIKQESLVRAQWDRIQKFVQGAAGRDADFGPGYDDLSEGHREQLLLNGPDSIESAMIRAQTREEHWQMEKPAPDTTYGSMRRWYLIMWAMVELKEMISRKKKKMAEEYVEKWREQLDSALEDAAGHELLYGRGFILLSPEGPRALHPTEVILTTGIQK